MTPTTFLVASLALVTTAFIAGLLAAELADRLGVDHTATYPRHGRY